MYVCIYIFFSLSVYPVVDCGPLPNITGGTVQLRNGSKLSSTAVYSCNDGYAVQEGDILRTCLINGQWSGISLVCIRGGESILLTLVYVYNSKVHVM